MNTTKSSSTLRFLERNEVFTLEEYMHAVDPTVSVRTRYANLSNALRRGQAYRLRRGLYASNLGVYRDRVPNVYVVASKAAPDAVVSHHSALELHGVAHTPLRAVYYTSSHRVDPFEARGYRFTRLGPPQPLGDNTRFSTQARSGDALVPVTTRERTLVDCMRDVSAAGGLEEVLRSLGGFASVSVDAVAEYLSLVGSPTVTARVGWVLELFAESWGIDSDTLEQMAHSVGRGSYRLMRDEGPQRFVGRWRLYVPEALPYAEWVRG